MVKSPTVIWIKHHTVTTFKLILFGHPMVDTLNLLTEESKHFPCCAFDCFLFLFAFGTQILIRSHEVLLKIIHKAVAKWDKWNVAVKMVNSHTCLMRTSLVSERDLVVASLFVRTSVIVCMKDLSSKWLLLCV